MDASGQGSVRYGIGWSGRVAAQLLPGLGRQTSAMFDPEQYGDGPS